MTPRVTGRRAPASMRGRRAAAHLAAEASMRASSSRVASRGEPLARRLGVAAPGPRRDLTPGWRIWTWCVRSSRDASTSPREWSIVSRGVPTVGFAASAIVPRSGRESRTARRPRAGSPRSLRHPATRRRGTGIATRTGVRPRSRWTRSRHRGPRRGPTATSRRSRTPCPSRGASGLLIAAGIVNDAPPELSPPPRRRAPPTGSTDTSPDGGTRRASPGRTLDPAGDKAFVASVAVALAWKGAIRRPPRVSSAATPRSWRGWRSRGARGLGWRWETWGEFLRDVRGESKHSRGDEREGSRGEPESSPSPAAAALPARSPRRWGSGAPPCSSPCSAARLRRKPRGARQSSPRRRWRPFTTSPGNHGGVGGDVLLPLIGQVQAEARAHGGASGRARGAGKGEDARGEGAGATPWRGEGRPRTEDASRRREYGEDGGEGGGDDGARRPEYAPEAGNGAAANVGCDTRSLSLRTS